ncbi:MAG: hypothetical protein LBG06_00625 [Deltaproteobacteria bacterium]|nr:hypothetical protein [Deltaproteobacteria bacterium]
MAWLKGIANLFQAAGAPGGTFLLEEAASPVAGRARPEFLDDLGMAGESLARPESSGGILIASGESLEGLDSHFQRRIAFRMEFRRPGPSAWWEPFIPSPSHSQGRA